MSRAGQGQASSARDDSGNGGHPAPSVRQGELPVHDRRSAARIGGAQLLRAQPPRHASAASRSRSSVTSSTSSSTCGVLPGASSAKATLPPRPGSPRRAMPCSKARPASPPARSPARPPPSVSTAEAQEGRRVRAVLEEQAALPRLSDSALGWLPDRHRSDRRGLPAPRPRPVRHHRCSVVPRGSRGDAEAPSCARQWRLGGVLATPSRCRARTRPRIPLRRRSHSSSCLIPVTPEEPHPFESRTPCALKGT